MVSPPAELSALARGEYTHPEAFAHRPIPRKGSGLVAVQAIPLGTLLIRARGLNFSAEATAAAQQDSDAGGGLLVEAVENLSALRKRCAADADAVLSGWRRLCPRPLAAPEEIAPLEPQRELLQELLGHFSDTGIEGPSELMQLVVKLQVNVFEGGLFPLAASLNHSCAPNCSIALRQRQVGNDDDELEWVCEIRTMREISRGNELCISYLSLRAQHLSAPQRVASLVGWGFACACPRCAPQDHQDAGTPQWNECEKQLGAVRCPRCSGVGRQRKRGRDDLSAQEALQAASKEKQLQEKQDAVAADQSKPLRGPWCLEFSADVPYHPPPEACSGADRAEGTKGWAPCLRCGRQPDAADTAALRRELRELAAGLAQPPTDADLERPGVGISAWGDTVFQRTGPLHWLRFAFAEAQAARYLARALSLRDQPDKQEQRAVAVAAHLAACRRLVVWAEATECWAPHERGFARLLDQLATAIRANGGGAEVAEAEAAEAETRALCIMDVAYGGHDSYECG